MAKNNNQLALVLSGGGARAAFQVGFLRCLAKHFPDLEIPILTGVSAGAINAAFLANHGGTFAEAVDDLTSMWCSLTTNQVFRTDAWSLLKNVTRWGRCLTCGGPGKNPSVRGFVDTRPLAQLLSKHLAANGDHLNGVAHKVRQGRLRALAITGTNYGTGRAVTWVQGCDLKMWERPDRRSVETEFSIHHIMASAALPIFFPAITIGNAWFGDGGIRQAAPLSPALHLGAGKIMAISTRYKRPLSEAEISSIKGYPPPAQILGTLMNAVFLDALDQDARSLRRINQLLGQLPQTAANNHVPVDLFMLRPTSDLGQLSGRFEPQLPGMFRYLLRGLGSTETNTPDWLSMVIFEQPYLERLISIGEADGETRLPQLEAFLNPKN